MTCYNSFRNLLRQLFHLKENLSQFNLQLEELEIGKIHQMNVSEDEDKIHQAFLNAVRTPEIMAQDQWCQ